MICIMASVGFTESLALVLELIENYYLCFEQI